MRTLYSGHLNPWQERQREVRAANVRRCENRAMRCVMNGNRGIAHVYEVMADLWRDILEGQL